MKKRRVVLSSARPLAVLHLHSGLGTGGTQVMLATLARERLSCPTMIPAFALCFSGPLASTLTAADCAVHLLGEVKARFPWQIFGARRRLRRLLKSGAFSAVICHSSWALALFGSVIAASEAALVFWHHNNATRDNRNLLEWFAGAQAPALAIANSSFTASTLPVLFSRRMPPARIIHCPVAPPPCLGAARTTTRASHGVTDSDCVIIQVGRLERWKGHGLHLEALARLRDLPGWLCWIVGGASTDPAYAAELEHTTTALGLAGRVRFFGARDDVPTLLAAADVFCQPNLDPEPFGIVFVEALYAGLPVASTRQGGVCEIVSEDCGCLTPPGDAAALADALRSLLTDSARRARLAAAAPARARAVSSPDHILPAIHDALCALVPTS
jgi:glycosyltransferase involved in cell wall biosynthesis